MMPGMKPPPTTSERAPIAARGPRQLADLVLDVRFTLRALRRDSAFAASAIVILAIAIGLNVTIFTIVPAPDEALRGIIPPGPSPCSQRSAGRTRAASPSR